MSVKRKKIDGEKSRLSYFFPLGLLSFVNRKG